ncbi:MAG: YfhO family protein [Anaerolineae bacterium]|nr:YfhO family protein [Anaerolineae bacterium]
MRSGGNLQKTGPALAVAALVPVFCARLILTPLIIAHGDAFTYFYPYWHAASDALRAGRLPLWNDLIFMGAPFLANGQTGLLYLPNLLVWLLVPDTPTAYTLSLLLHLVWAGLGMLALLRLGMRANSPAALTGAALFTVGGALTTHAGQINQLQGMAWLPWLFLLLDRSRRSPFAPVLLAAALAMQILAGHAQTVFIGAVGMGVAALWWAWRDSGIYHGVHGAHGEGVFKSSVCSVSLWFMRRFAGVIALTTAGVAALVLTLPQLAPMLELSSFSNRAGGLPINEVVSFSLHPFLFGRALLPNYAVTLHGEFVGTIGVGGLALALMGAWWARKDPHWQAWIAVTAVGLVLASGKWNQFYWKLGLLPGFNLFRVPARWLALWAIGASVLAAYAVHVLTAGSPYSQGMEARRKSVECVSPLSPALSPTRGERESESRATATAHFPLAPCGRGGQGVRGNSALLRADKILILLFGAGVLVLVGVTYWAPQAKGLDVPGQVAPQPVELVLWLASLGAAAGALVFLRGRWAAGALIGLALLELFVMSHAMPMPYNRLAPPQAFSEPRPVIEAILAREKAAAVPARYLSIAGIEYEPGDRADIAARYAGYPESAVYDYTVAAKLKDVIAPNLGMIWGIATVDGYDGGVLPLQAWTDFTAPLLDEPAVDGRLRERLAAPPPADWGVKYLIAAPGVAVADEQWRLVAAGDVNLYERREPGAAVRLVESPDAGAPVAGRAVITRYAPEALTIETDGAGDAYVLLLDAYYPGWTAAVDGEAAQVLPAMGMFRAVPVPAGEHVVQMNYLPTSWPAAWVIGAAAWSVLVGVGGIVWRRAGRPGYWICR